MPNSDHLYRRGIQVSVASIIWTVLASGLSIYLGLTSDSIVLVAFGFTGAFDAAGSAALVLHFRHSLRHGSFSESHERIALLVVTVGLIVVAVATAVGSVLRLLSSSESGESTTGVLVATVSIFVLALLAVLKRRTGSAIPSPALAADGMLSLTGSVLAVVTVAGSLLTRHGIHWADPVAALFVAAGALGIVVIIHRGD